MIGVHPAISERQLHRLLLIWPILQLG